MSNCDLLTVTLRRVQKYESETITTEILSDSIQAYAKDVIDITDFNDTIKVNGKSVDIFGNITDEEIYAIGEAEKSNNSIEVIVTNEDVTPTEVHEILASKNLGSMPVRISYLGRTNPTIPTIMQRLHKKAVTSYPIVPPESPGPSGPGGSGDSGGSDGSGGSLIPGGGSNTPKDPANGDPTKPNGCNYIIARKSDGANKTTGRISVDSDEKIIKVTNLFDSGDYYYKVKSTDGSSVNATFTVLDNGRLLIEGNNIVVEAIGNQNDDIIIIGNHNEIYTNSGDDSVRVGWAQDLDQYHYVLNTNLSNDNYVNTGTGNDYVQSYGSNKVDMGDGTTDSLYDVWNKLTTYSGVESLMQGHTFNSGQVLKNNTENVFDYNPGWGMQGGYGDCKYLSFLNSFNNGKFNIKNYVRIESNAAGGYNVWFLRGNDKNLISVSQSDLQGYKNVQGDIDYNILETAFQKVLAKAGYNMDSGSNSLGSNNFLISKYFFGIDKGGFIIKNNEELFSKSFVELWNAYKDGKISNLMVGSTQSTSKENKQIGIMAQHEYSVKNVSAYNYVELVNPHDTKDTIKLDWDDFLKYFETVDLFGDTYTYVADRKDEENFKGQVFYNDMSTAPQYHQLLAANSEQEAEVNSNKGIYGIFDEIAEIEQDIININDIVSGYKNLELYS